MLCQSIFESTSRAKTTPCTRTHAPIHSSSIAFKTHFTNCVREVLAYRGYAETEDDQWNIFWCEKEQIPEALSTIKNHERKVNHFRNYY